MFERSQTNIGFHFTTISSMKWHIYSEAWLKTIDASAPFQKRNSEQLQWLKRLIKTNRRGSLLDTTNKFNKNSNNVAAIFILQLHLHENVYLRRISEKKSCCEGSQYQDRTKENIIDWKFLKKKFFSELLEDIFPIGLFGARETRDEGLILWQESAMLWGCVTLGGVRTVTGNTNAK